MSRGKKMRAVLNDKEIEAISKLQRFTYRCIKMFNDQVSESPSNRSNEEKESLMNRWATKLFQDKEFSIVFDETLWLPDDPGSVGNIVKIIIESQLPGYTSIKIDFRKGFHNCVTFYDGDNDSDINIFDVQYTESVN